MTQSIGISSSSQPLIIVEEDMKPWGTDSTPESLDSKRPHSDMQSSSSRDSTERTSKVAKQLTGQDAVTNTTLVYQSNSPFLKLLGSACTSGPFNHILTCLKLSDVITLRETAKPFATAIKPIHIPILFKQQLENKRTVTYSDLNKYKKLSGRQLFSNKIETLIFSEINSAKAFGSKEKTGLDVQIETFFSETIDFAKAFGSKGKVASDVPSDDFFSFMKDSKI